MSWPFESAGHQIGHRLHPRRVRIRRCYNGVWEFEGEHRP